jgi:hypothetical protein
VSFRIPEDGQSPKKPSYPKYLEMIALLYIFTIVNIEYVLFRLLFVNQILFSCSKLMNIRKCLKNVSKGEIIMDESDK